MLNRHQLYHVPARASIARERCVNENRCWTNVIPISDQFRSWYYNLSNNNRDIISIGKWHFKNSEKASGFSKETLPLHVKDQENKIRELEGRKKIFTLENYNYSPFNWKIWVKEIFTKNQVMFFTECAKSKIKTYDNLIKFL